MQNDELRRLGPNHPLTPSFIFGSRDLYSWLDGNHRVRMMRTEHTNDPALIAHQRLANHHLFADWGFGIGEQTGNRQGRTARVSRPSDAPAPPVVHPRGAVALERGDHVRRDADAGSQLA